MLSNVLTSQGHTDSTITKAASVRSPSAHLPFFEAQYEFIQAIGEEYCILDRAKRANWARTSLPSGTMPSVVVRPNNADQVKEIVRIALKYNLKLHPISTGKNWGYGDACAHANGHVLLDLGRMNRILEVNTELAYAVIEPGVTQGQLYRHLEDHDIPLMMDATGAGPEAGIVGNILERGTGHTRNGDRFANACNFEVVLPNAQTLNTGFGGFPNAQAASVHKQGAGPALDGLFTQSNLGIITKMTVWLMPKPPVFKIFFFGVKKAEDIGGLIEGLRPLRLRGTLQSLIHIGNDLRIISMSDSYPWREMQGETPLSPEMRAQLRKRTGTDGWHGCGALYGTRGEVNAAAREIRKALRKVEGICQVHFFDARKMSFVRSTLNMLGKIGIGRTLSCLFEKVELTYELLRGHAPEVCVQGGLWRSKKQSEQSSADPLDYQAGFIWIAPVLPMAKVHIDRVNQMSERILNRHGFDYQVTVNLISERALCAVQTISFDKSNPDEVQRAQRCHDELLDALVSSGYVPYRLGNLSHHTLASHAKSTYNVISKIKNCLDPADMLSPARFKGLKKEKALIAQAEGCPV